MSKDWKDEACENTHKAMTTPPTFSEQLEQAAHDCALNVYADGHDPELKGRALALWAVGSGFKAGAAWAIESPLVKELEAALEHYSKLEDWPMLPAIARDALAALAKARNGEGGK